MGPSLLGQHLVRIDPRPSQTTAVMRGVLQVPALSGGAYRAHTSHASLYSSTLSSDFLSLHLASLPLALAGALFGGARSHSGTFMNAVI